MLPFPPKKKTKQKTPNLYARFCYHGEERKKEKKNTWEDE
jgi:hypothetical protein